MGDGTADGTGKGESGVEVEAAELLRSVGAGSLDDRVNLGRAGGCWRRHGGRVCKGG